MSGVHEQIAQYEGLTSKKVLEMAAGLHMEKLQRGDTITSPADTVEYLRSVLGEERNEVFHVVFLDTRHRVITGENMFFGTVDGAVVYPRNIIQRALELNAGALIVAHNHPSGVAEPSLADKHITKQIREAGSLIQLRLLDHFIIGQGEYVSLASRGDM